MVVSSCDVILLPSSDQNPGSISSSLTTSLIGESSQGNHEGVCSPTSTPVVTVNTSEDFELFFAPTTKVMFDFSMPTQTLLNINEFGNDRARRDTYHQVSVKIAVTPLNQETVTYCYPIVGLRMKGNTSRTDFVESSGLIKDFVHFKIDFRSDDLTRNYVPNAYFFGMTQLDLKWNRNLDHTQIRQLYGHKMFRDFIPMMTEATLGGVTIHQTNQSNPELQSTYMGLYTIIEQTNRRFFVRNLGDNPESNGNLYKTLYTSTGPADFTRTNAVNSDGTTHFRTGNRIGVENNATSYNPSYDLKTNSTLPNFTDMVNLIGEINATTQFNNENFKSRLEAVVDIEAFIMTEAVAYFFGNPDNLRNWFNNNYVYFLPSTGQAFFIPYDLDRGLGSNGTWDPTIAHNEFSQYGPSMTKIGPFEEALLRIWNDGKQNPLHRFTVMNGGIPTYLNMYREKLAQVANSVWVVSDSLGGGQYAGKFYQIHSQYRATYYPVTGDYFYLQPTSPPLSDYFVPFSINQNTLSNITYHTYISAKLNTYRQAVA